jgi:cardiolipin synthase
MAREANIVVLDPAFAQRLRGELVTSIERDGVPLHAHDYARRGLVARAADWLAYMVVRLATALLARSPGY